MTVPTRSPPASITNDDASSSSLTAVPTSAQPATMTAATSAAPPPPPPCPTTTTTTATPSPPPTTTTTAIPTPPLPPPPAVAPFPKVLTPSSPAPSLSSACSMSTSSSTASTSAGSTKVLTTTNNNNDNNPNNTDVTMDTDAEHTTVTNDDNNNNNSSTTKRVRQGDMQWMKVMETKENQWRYLHSLALHEMNSRERAACDQLHGLCSRLNELVEACDRTERVVRRCRTHRFQQEVVRVAAKPVQQAVAHLSAARYISGANDMVDTMQHSIKVANNNNNMSTNNNKSSGDSQKHNNDHVLAELEKFRVEALRFRTVAKDVGLVQLIGLASSLEKLADMVADETGVVKDTAQRVKQSGRAAEVARSKLLNDMVQQQRAKMDAKAGCLSSTDGKQQEHCRHVHQHHQQQQPQQEADDQQQGDRCPSVSSSSRPSS